VLPITTIRFSSDAISGATASASATLVTGPTGQSVISPGFSRAMRMIRSTADFRYGAPSRLGECDVAQPVGAVNVIGAFDERLQQRAPGAARNRDVIAAGEFENAQGVLRRRVDVGVAERGGERFEAKFRGGAKRRGSPSRRRCRYRRRGSFGRVRALPSAFQRVAPQFVEFPTPSGISGQLCWPGALFG